MNGRKPVEHGLARGKYREAWDAPGPVVPGLLAVVGITRLVPDRVWHGQRQLGTRERVVSCARERGLLCVHSGVGKAVCARDECAAHMEEVNFTVA